MYKSCRSVPQRTVYSYSVVYIDACSFYVCCLLKINDDDDDDDDDALLKPWSYSFFDVPL